MKKYNVQQEGGFPFETDTLTFQQKAYEIFNAYGELAGDKTIIKGCEVVGSEVSDGFIYINGELFEFKGGVIADSIILRETATEVEFEDGENNEVYFERWYEFGVATNSIPWNEIKRINRYKPYHKEFRLVGASVLQEDLEQDWHIANGSNGTDDLRDLFIKVAGTGESPGQSSGSKTRTLGASNIPKHRHKMLVKDGVMGDSNDDNPGGGGEGGRRTMDASTDNGAYTEYSGADNPSAFNIEPQRYLTIAIQYIKSN